MEGDEDEQMVDRSSGLASNVWSTKKVTEESGGTVERKKFRHRNVDKGPYTMDRHEKGDRGRPGAGAECYGQFGSRV